MSKRNRASNKKANPLQETSPTNVDPSSSTPFFRKHMLVGWWSLLLFLTLGLVLEAMHGFKLPWYVSGDNATRRLMFTLAHTHGTLLSLVHIAFAFSIRELHRVGSVASGATSWCLTLAGFLLPLGFLAGGWYTYHGDPGLGILMVPVGGLLLLVAVLMTALSIGSIPRG